MTVYGFKYSAPWAELETPWKPLGSEAVEEGGGGCRMLTFALLTGPGLVLSSGLQCVFILPWLMGSRGSCFSSIKVTTAGKLHGCFMLSPLHSYIQEMYELCMNLSHCVCVFLGQYLKSKLFSVCSPSSQHTSQTDKSGFVHSRTLQNGELPSPAAAGRCWTVLRLDPSGLWCLRPLGRGKAGPTQVKILWTGGWSNSSEEDMEVAEAKKE